MSIDIRKTEFDRLAAVIHSSADTLIIDRGATLTPIAEIAEHLHSNGFYAAHASDERVIFKRPRSSRPISTAADFYASSQWGRMLLG